MDSRRQEGVWEINIMDAMCSGKPPTHHPLKVMTLHEYDTVMQDRPKKAGIMLSTGRFWQVGMTKEEALRPLPMSTTALVRQLALRYIPNELKCCHGAPKRTVTQGARTDPGEGNSGIAPPVITLEDTIAPLVEKIIAREEKDRQIKENKVPLTEHHYSPNHKSEDDSEDEQTSHSGDTSVTLSNNDTSNSHNISQAQSKPSASSTPAKASSMELSLDTSSIKSRMKSAKGRLGQLGKRLNNLAENIRNDRTKKTRSTSRISEEDQDESILESECPDAYRGHTSRPRAKGARKTTLCHIAQCLARGPDLVEDEADDITLPFYDTMTVTEALTACTLTAGTRFDMT
jgi:hypothetical protein